MLLTIGGVCGIGCLQWHNHLDWGQNFLTMSLGRCLPLLFPHLLLLLALMLLIRLHGLLLESLVDGILGSELLHIILSVLVISIHLLESLTGDAHVGRLRLVRHLKDLFLFILSLLYTRLYHLLVAEGTLEAVVGRVLLNLAPVIDLLVILLS